MIVIAYQCTTESQGTSPDALYVMHKTKDDACLSLDICYCAVNRFTACSSPVRLHLSMHLVYLGIHVIVDIPPHNNIQ